MNNEHFILEANITEKRYKYWISGALFPQTSSAVIGSLGTQAASAMKLLLVTTSLLAIMRCQEG